MTDLPPPPIEAIDPVDALRWERRVIVVFAVDADDADWRRQQEMFAPHIAAFAERDLTVFLVMNEGPVLRDGTPIAAHAAQFLRWRTGDGFEAVLVGKDGGAKLRSDAPINADALFSLIDAMPMRRREMDQRTNQ